LKHSVITGGGGFIGSHLCETLLAKGHRVTCVDNFSTGSRSNVAHLLGDKNFTLLEHNVVRPFEVEGSVHNVLHFASPASPPTFGALALEILMVNSVGTLVCLELARKHKATFMVASTSEVYGDPDVHPQVEQYRGNVSTTGPRATYDESKRFSETATTVYSRRFGLDTRIVRIFNTYGPRMRLDDGRVLPNLIGQALRGEDLTVFGDGSQTRCFCYVDDLVSGLMLLLESSVTEPVNLGSPHEITIMRFAEEVRRVVGCKNKIVHKELPMDDPKRRQPDIGRARKLLGWEPRVPLSDGLKHCLEYFRKVQTAPK
jgi:dTDP-glucose 4,6-dehydratase